MFYVAWPTQDTSVEVTQWRYLICVKHYTNIDWCQSQHWKIMPLSCVMLLEGRRPVGNIAQLRGIIFTVLHVMQTRYSNENSVCLPVRLSVCHTRVFWQNGRKICPDFYTIRKIIYPSLLRRMIGGGRPLLPKILGQPAPVGAKSPILNQ